MSEVVHISSHPVKVGAEIRQRCVWCGETLVEEDLRFVALQLNQDGSTPEFPTWPTDVFVGKDGGMTYVVDPPSDNKVPKTFCGAPNDISSLEEHPQ